MDRRKSPCGGSCLSGGSGNISEKLFIIFDSARETNLWSSHANLGKVWVSGVSNLSPFEKTKQFSWKCIEVDWTIDWSNQIRILLLRAFTLHCEVFCGNGFIHCPTSNAFFFDSDSVKAGSRLNGKLSRAMEKEAHEINHLACGLDLVVFGFTSGSLVGCWSVIITLYCPLQCFLYDCFQDRVWNQYRSTNGWIKDAKMLEAPKVKETKNSQLLCYSREE